MSHLSEIIKELEEEARVYRTEAQKARDVEECAGYYGAVDGLYRAIDIIETWKKEVES